MEKWEEGLLGIVEDFGLQGGGDGEGIARRGGREEEREGGGH